MKPLKSNQLALNINYRREEIQQRRFNLKEFDNQHFQAGNNQYNILIQRNIK